MNQYQNSSLTFVGSPFFFLFLVFTINSNAHAFDRDKFYEELSAANGIYKEHIAKEEIRRLVVEGNINESNNRLKNLIPTKNKAFYDYFILGNMLFKLDWESSKKYMKEAEKLQPDNPLVQFERGIHEHKSNNYSVASDYYRRFHKSEAGRTNPVSWAYLTHAYLMSGQVEEAFKAWGNVRFGKNHTAVEKGMYALFSVAKQESVRERLISDIKAGHLTKLCDLWVLDSNWEVDWWNYKAKDEFLRFDLELANKTLEKGSPEERYFEFCSSEKKLGNDDYMSELKNLDILAGNRRLPESSALIYKILQRLMASKLMQPAEFLDTFEPQIRMYAERNPFDQKYYEVLAFLYVETGDRENLQDIDLHGWQKLKSERFASSYIAGLDPKSESYQTFLNEALADFPHSVTLNKFKLTDSSEDPANSMARFVAAQFANVKNNWSGPYRLNDYMASLKLEYNKLNN